MTAFLLLVILSEVLLPNLTCASRVRRQNTKVRISSAGDTIMLKFLQLDHDTKLGGYILGYGSNMFSKQYIQLPENGEPYETVIDAEPKYLIAVQPIIEDEVKKECAGQDTLNKPLHLVIGSVTPTSVLLSWGTILRPPYTDANLVDCSDDSQYTVRYKEKESSDNWSYQTCPTTDTVIEKLNLDTTYEFGVRAETDTISGTWSPPVTHNTGDIFKPVSPVIQTSSPEPTTEEPHPTEAYVQPLQILQNVTSSRMTPTSRHTSFPTPKTTLGPESDGIASSPSSEDFLFLTHTCTHPPMGMPPSKTTKIFQPKSLTTTQQQFYTTLLQLTTNKTPVSTTKTQSSENKILSSTGKALLNTERSLKRTIAIHPHHQPETSTTQVQSTMIKYQPKATHKNLITPQHRSVTLQPITTQSQTYTTKSQIDTTQSQPLPTQSKAPTTQSQAHPTQSKAPTIQYQPHPTQSKATTQSQPHPTQSKAPTIQYQPHPTQSKATTQSQPHPTQSKAPTLQSQPHPTQSKAPTLQSQPHPTQSKAPTLQSQPHPTHAKATTTQSQPHPTQSKAPITQSLPHPTQSKAPTLQSQPHSIQSKATTTQSQAHPTKSKAPTTQAQPQPTQSKATTTHSQPHPTQSKTPAIQSQPHPTQSKAPAIQSQPHPTQSKAPAIQSLPHPTQSKATTTQSQPHPTKSKTPTTQSQAHLTQSKATTTQFLPHPTQSKATTTQSQPHPTQSKAPTIQSQPHTTQTLPISTELNPTLSLPSTSKTRLIMTQPTPRKPQEPSKTPESKRILQKSSTAQPQNTKEIYQPVTNLLTNIILENSVTNIPLNLSNSKSDIDQDFESPHTTPQHPLAPSSTEAGILEDTASSHTTSQHLPHIATDTPSPTQRKDSYSTSSTETNTNLRNPPRCSTTFKPQPVVEHHPTSATKSHLNTSPKSNNSQNSPQTEKKVVNKKPPGSKQGSFDSYSVVYQSAPAITQSSSPLQDTQPPTLPVSLMSDRNQDQINSTSPAVHPSVTTVQQHQINSTSPAVHPSVTTVQQPPSQQQDGRLTPKPFRVKTNRSRGRDNTLSSMVSPSASTVKQRRGNSSPSVVPPLKAEAIQSPHDEKHKGIAQPKPVNEPLTNLELQGNPPVPFKKKLNQVEKENEVKTGDLPDLKQLDQLPLLKPQVTPVAEKSVHSTAAPTPTLFTPDGSRFDFVGNSSGFSSVPVSDVDAMGKKRFVGPNVIYKTDKPLDQPCSVTQSLSLFPEEEGVAINVTGPPKTPPTNLTVVAVERCPSFIILVWEKTDNETTEYDVTSSIKSPNGDKVSVVTTNQTHTAVENLKPESSYEFTVIPKNEMGSGPPSELVSFNTESADPRVSEIPTGRNAIWSSFPFKADSYSECTGNMYVKRTWYRKFVGIQLCNSLRYKIYLSDSLKGKFYNIGDIAGNGEDHCQFVDSYLDGRTGGPLATNQLPLRKGFFRSLRQEPVRFGKIGGNSHINYVAWYECGVPIPGSW